ncbi:MAG: hypothetical protein WCJ33_09200, partial [Pseudomonadota bacterium]
KISCYVTNLRIFIDEGYTTPYFMAVRGNLPNGTITPIGNFIPAVQNIRVAGSAGALQVGAGIPPTCTAPNFLTFDGTAYQCNSPAATPIPPTPPGCFSPNLLTFNGSSYDCKYVPVCSNTQRVRWDQPSNSYVCDDNPPGVIGHGIATPSVGGCNVHCAGVNFTPGITGDITKLQLNATIFYPPGVGHAWTHWTTFLQNANPGAGYAEVCMDSGGWCGDIYSEKILWSITYMP